MNELASVLELKTDRREVWSMPADIKIRPHIAYLDFLKKYGLLEKAIEGTLPGDIERAAKTAVVYELIEKHGRHNIKVIDNGSGAIAISVNADSKDLEQAEVNDYIRHYKLEKFTQAMQMAEAFREITKGGKYEIRSGQFLNQCVLVKGLDTEVFGVPWHENFGHPICENHIYRVQRDSLHMRGRTFVCKLLSDQSEVLIHETEIGLAIIF